MRVVNLGDSIRRLEYGREVWLKFDRHHLRFKLKSEIGSGDQYRIHNWKFQLFLTFGYSENSSDYQEILMGEFYEMSAYGFFEQSFLSVHTLATFIGTWANEMGFTEAVGRLLELVLNQNLNLSIAIEQDETVLFKTWVHVEQGHYEDQKDLEFQAEIPLKELNGKIMWSNPSFASKTA